MTSSWGELNESMTMFCISACQLRSLEQDSQLAVTSYTLMSPTTHLCHQLHNYVTNYTLLSPTTHFCHQLHTCDQLHTSVTNYTLLQTPQQTLFNPNVFCRHHVNQKQHKYRVVMFLLHNTEAETNNHPFLAK